MISSDKMSCGFKGFEISIRKEKRRETSVCVQDYLGAMTYERPCCSHTYVSVWKVLRGALPCLSVHD